MKQSALVLGLCLSVLFTAHVTAQQPTDASPTGADEKAKVTPDKTPDSGQIEKAIDRSKRPDKRSDRKPQLDPMALFQRLDRNSDGILTVDETPARLQQRLKQFDADGDGTITKQEFAAAITKRKGGDRPKAGKPKTGQDKAKSGSKDEMNRQRSEMDLASMLKRLDRDGDGKLSAEEAPERMKDKFARIDSNGDSFVDTEELTAAIKKMKSGTEKGRYGTDPEKSKGQEPKRPPGRTKNGG